MATLIPRPISGVARQSSEVECFPTERRLGRTASERSKKALAVCLQRTIPHGPRKLGRILLVLVMLAGTQ